jgi:hypothetical protein
MNPGMIKVESNYMAKRPSRAAARPPQDEGNGEVKLAPFTDRHAGESWLA